MRQDKQITASASSSAELIAGARRGEEKAFETLFHRNKQRVYALCLRISRNAADAEELTQEAFLQAFRKIHTFRGESAFSTWLHRLTVNIVLMRLRKKRVSETSLEGSVGKEELDQPQREFGAPDLALTGSIDRVQIERAVARLACGYRQIFMLHDVQGYKHHEIAALLGVSVGNSKSQLHKARAKLRRLLCETGPESRKELHLAHV